jgi:hypothetical protein
MTYSELIDNVLWIMFGEGRVNRDADPEQFE